MLILGLSNNANVMTLVVEISNTLRISYCVDKKTNLKIITEYRFTGAAFVVRGISYLNKKNTLYLILDVRNRKVAGLV